MKYTGLFALGCGLLTATAGIAGTTASDSKQTITTPEQPPLTEIISIDSSYDFSSRINQRNVRRVDTLYNSIELGHRIQVNGPWYFRVGAAYERYDLGSKDLGPLPNTMQSAAGVFALEYRYQDYTAWQFEIRPGVYFEHEVTFGAFDIPFNFGGVIPIVDKKFMAVVGVGGALLWKYPVFPAVGFLWIPRDNLQVRAYLPEPQIRYSVNDHLDVWFGGQFTEAAYKTGFNSDSDTSRGVIDYQDYRVGIGGNYSPRRGFNIALNAGYSIRQEFDFYRAEKRFISDPTPYVRLQASVEW